MTATADLRDQRDQPFDGAERSLSVRDRARDRGQARLHLSPDHRFPHPPEMVDEAALKAMIALLKKGAPV